MTVYPELGASLGFLTVAVLQSNEILTGVVKKYELDSEDDIWWPGKKPKVKIDGFFYPQLMHGPDKRYRPLVTGLRPFMTESSAMTAAELLLKYIRQLEPCPADRYAPEEQLLLFVSEEQPGQIAC